MAVKIVKRQLHCGELVIADYGGSATVADLKTVMDVLKGQTSPTVHVPLMKGVNLSRDVRLSGFLKSLKEVFGENAQLKVIIFVGAGDLTVVMARMGARLAHTDDLDIYNVSDMEAAEALAEQLLSVLCKEQS
jgi:hypothetical protein